MKNCNATQHGMNGRLQMGAGLVTRTALGLLGAGLLAVTPRAQAQTYALTNVWYASTNVANLSNGSVNRGMAYHALSNQVLIASTAPSISVLNAADASVVGSVNVSWLASASTFKLDQIGVADDGVIYGCNLQTAPSASALFKIYRWGSWNDTAQVTSFSGDPWAGTALSGKRIGDTFAVRGSGVNTVLLAGAGSANGFCLFSTTDGTSFTPTAVTLTGITIGSSIYGIAFYTNNTVLVKPNSSTLYLIQYPANFAGQSSVAGTVLATVPWNAAGITFLSCATTAGWLGTLNPINGARSTNTVFKLDFGGGTTALVSTNYSTPIANINGTGGVALGGAGGTNFLYSLDTANGLSAFQIITIPPQPPTISAPPVGVTGYPPYTLGVAVNGTSPFHYQWMASNSGTNLLTTFTNIPGANTNTFTVGSPSTNYYAVVITNTVGMVTSTPVLVTLMTPISNPVVTQLWRVAAGASGYTYLGTDNATRGLAYDTNSHRLVVSSFSGSTALYILDADYGTNLGTMSLSGLTLGGLAGIGIDQVGIADDGAVYAANLANATAGNTTFNLYRWPAPTTNAVGAVAYTVSDISTPTGDRWGDTLAVRGAGAATEILLGSDASTNVLFFMTYDGLTFSPAVMAISGVPSGFARKGVAFGAGNTFWAVNYDGDLWQISFDPVAQTGQPLLRYAKGSQFPRYMSAVGVDSAHNILGAISLGDIPPDLGLFQLTGTADAPVQFQQSFFATANGNGNQNAVVVMKYPRAYALDVNNGILGLSYGVPATTPATIITPPGNQTVYTNDPAVSLSVQVSGSLPIYYQWRCNATNIIGATNRSYTLNYPPVSASGYYDVVVRNLGGTVTSAPPALLLVMTPTASTVVTQLWSVAAGTRSYLDNNSYSTRGLAYDTNTATVLVADHFNIHVLSAADGSDLFQLNTAGLPTSGFNSWVVDQVGVADDGLVYGANLTVDGTTPFFIIQWSSVDAGASMGYAYPAGDPSNGTGDRWGDTLAVRGAGANTQLLLGSGGSTRVLFFTTLDGVNFTPTVIDTPTAPTGFASQGIAFGAGNTFWAKSPGYNLRQVAFDPVAGTGTVVQTYTAGTQVDSTMDGIGVDAGNNLLGGVVFSTTPHSLQLSVLSGGAAPPVVFDQAFFQAVNANGQLNAVTTMKAGKAFALDVNNGIVALAYGVPPAPLAGYALSATYQAGVGVTLTWDSVSNRNYQVQFKRTVTDLYWTNLGAPIVANSASTSYTDTAALGSARFYRVVGQ